MTANLPFPSPFAFDMALTAPVFAMTKRGFRVDRERHTEMLDTYTSEWGSYQEKLDALFGPTNVGSPKQMKELLYGMLKLPERKKDKKVTTDEDALRATMAYCEGKLKSQAKGSDRFQAGYLACLLALKIRNRRKVISSYLDIALDADNHIRTMISVGGTETGRFSHSKTLWGTGINLATVPHKLRVLYCPDEGKELAEFDLNRGESWVYAHLSEDPELLRIHTTNGDFHSETAIAIATVFGGKFQTVDEIKAALKRDKTDPLWNSAYKLRFLGKKVNHASAYRMGPFRMAEVVNEEADDTGITITVAEAKNAQELWRNKYHQMPRWWERVENQLNRDRTMRTVYGRQRTFYGFWGDHLFKEATAYEPQSTSVDYLNLGMLRVYNDLDRTGLVELLHQNHDSIVIQYDPARRDEVFPEVISRLESKVRLGDYEFTIPVEGSFGPNWKDLTEWEG